MPPNTPSTHIQKGEKRMRRMLIAVGVVAALVVAGVLSAFVARSRRDAIVYAAIVAGVWRHDAGKRQNLLLRGHVICPSW